MKNLFDADTYTETVERINKLSPSSTAMWGKMNVAQMLRHCIQAFKVPLSEKQIPRMFLGRILGPFIKAKLYNEEPWKQNLPTSPDFIVKHECDFMEEKKGLLLLVNKFYAAGPMGISKYPHPFFGSFTPEQWGKSMFKHLDHHLKQFGA